MNGDYNRGRDSSLVGTIRREEREGRATPPHFRNLCVEEQARELNANDRQHGGDHYRRARGIQHWDFVHMVGLGYYNGNATKYASRHRFKNGSEDLEKALHYCDKAIELDLDSPEVMRHIDDFEMIMHQFAADNDLIYDEYVAVRLLSLSRYQEARHVIEHLLKHMPRNVPKD